MRSSWTREKRILAFVLALALCIPLLVTSLYGENGAPAAGATITVDTVEDVMGDDGLCSLREAIVAANTDRAFHDCPAGSGADTVLLGADLPEPAVLTLAIAGRDEDGALSGDLDLDGQLIVRAAHQTVVDGGGLDRVFEILPGARVTISGLTVRNGDPGTGAHSGIASGNVPSEPALRNRQSSGLNTLNR